MNPGPQHQEPRFPYPPDILGTPVGRRMVFLTRIDATDVWWDEADSLYPYFINTYNPAIALWYCTGRGWKPDLNPLVIKAVEFCRNHFALLQ